jgi:hypothetical protein
MRIYRILVAVLFLTLASAAFAQDKPAAGAGAGKPSPEQMMAEMMKLATPGPEHERLKAMEGTFNADVTMQMAPDAPPINSKGTMINKMILGGRYLQGDYKGEFMGQPFTGISMTGYDNATKKYVATWMDSMSTTVMMATGTADSTGKTITTTATVECPMDQGGPKTMKQVTTIIDKDHHTYECYEVAKDGKETKMMTIKYTRAGESASR